MALALQDDGWMLRSDIIWHKPNAMPSSVKNRPTTDHEYVFFFSKSKDYFYDADAIREPHVTFSEKSRMGGGRNHFFRRDGTPENGQKRWRSESAQCAAGIRPSIPKAATNGPSGPFPCRNSAKPTSPFFPTAGRDLLSAGCPQGGIVLDPFLGSGTTAIVAQRLGRHFVGIDCNRDYCDIARRRIARIQA